MSAQPAAGVGKAVAITLERKDERGKNVVLNGIMGEGKGWRTWRGDADWPAEKNQTTEPEEGKQIELAEFSLNGRWLICVANLVRKILSNSLA
jgi:hypothetical protein